MAANVEPAQTCIDCGQTKIADQFYMFGKTRDKRCKKCRGKLNTANRNKRKAASAQVGVDPAPVVVEEQPAKPPCPPHHWLVGDEAILEHFPNFYKYHAAPRNNEDYQVCLHCEEVVPVMYGTGKHRDVVGVNTVVAQAREGRREEILRAAESPPSSPQRIPIRHMPFEAVPVNNTEYIEQSMKPITLMTGSRSDANGVSWGAQPEPDLEAVTLVDSEQASTDAEQAEYERVVQADAAGELAAPGQPVEDDEEPLLRADEPDMPPQGTYIFRGLEPGSRVNLPLEAADEFIPYTTAAAPLPILSPQTMLLSPPSKLLAAQRQAREFELKLLASEQEAASLRDKLQEEIDSHTYVQALGYKQLKALKREVRGLRQRLNITIVRYKRVKAEKRNLELEARLAELERHSA